jgi:hypothetical protein
MILRLSEYLNPVIIFSLIIVTLGFVNGLTPFEIILVLIVGVFSWITTWEGYLLASEKKKVAAIFLGGVGTLEAGKNIEVERQPIDLMPGEILLVETEAFKKKILGYASGKLSITNFRIYFVPRDPIFSRASRMALLQKQLKELKILNGRDDHSMRKLVVNNDVFLVSPSFQLPALNVST